ncbi:MAG: SHOCT domain-containing protein [Crocinitomicaceae bacterium]|nr:SHOCT domain-containing protein [Crocinitomicaceae bacterium]
MKVVFMGIMGPWQTTIIVGVLGFIGLIIAVVVLSNSRAKHKAKSEALDTVVKTHSINSSDNLDKIERLNKMRESGALTQDEFESEKKKILR